MSDTLNVAAPTEAPQGSQGVSRSSRMKKGTEVVWQLPNVPVGRWGHGVTLSDEEDGHIIVAVNDFSSETSLGYHPVIYCAVTWLKDASTIPPVAPVAKPTPTPGLPQP